MAQGIFQWQVFVGKIQVNMWITLKLGYFFTIWPTVILPDTALSAVHSLFLAAILSAS